MNELLRDIYVSCEDPRARGRKKLSKALKGTFDRRYEQILSRGMMANPLPEPPRNQPKKRGKVKKSKAGNLLERLRDHKDEVLTFMYNFQAPFDNNRAESDLRMAKLKQKISGTFRTWEGANAFCRVRGYISTARKNQVPVIQALTDAFEGRPFIPVPSES